MCVDDSPVNTIKNTQYKRQLINDVSGPRFMFILKSASYIQFKHS